MPIAQIVTRGFGATVGSAKYLPVRGFLAGTAAPITYLTDLVLTSPGAFADGDSIAAGALAQTETFGGGNG